MEHVIGIAGVLLLLGAYYLGSSGKLSPRSNRYQLMNLIGSAIGVWYSGSDRWVWAGLNIVWAGIALATLIRFRRER